MSLMTHAIIIYNMLPLNCEIKLNEPNYCHLNYSVNIIQMKKKPPMESIFEYLAST